MVAGSIGKFCDKETGSYELGGVEGDWTGAWCLKAPELDLWLGKQWSWTLWLGKWQS